MLYISCHKYVLRISGLYFEYNRTELLPVSVFFFNAKYGETFVTGFYRNDLFPLRCVCLKLVGKNETSMQEIKCFDFCA